MYHSTLGGRVIRNKKRAGTGRWCLIQGLCFTFKGSGFGFKVLGLRLWVSGFGFRVLGFGFLVSGFGFRVSGFGFSGFRFRFSVSGFRVSGFGFQVWGLGFGEAHLCLLLHGAERLHAVHRLRDSPFAIESIRRHNQTRTPTMSSIIDIAHGLFVS